MSRSAKFERDVRDAFNRHFSSTGVSYRLKQAKYTGQKTDVLVDNPYLGVECKSRKMKSSNKLYFTADFSEKDGVHQVETITKFLRRSGRDGYLAVECRKGRGLPREGYLIPWKYVRAQYDNLEKKIDLEKIANAAENKRWFAYRLVRIAGTYKLSDRFITEQL